MPTRRYSTQPQSGNVTSRIALILIILLAVFAVGCVIWAFANNGSVDDGKANDGIAMDMNAEPGSIAKAGDAPSGAAVQNAKNVVLTMGGDKHTYVLKDEEYLEPGCRAYDKNTGDISSTVKVSGNVDTSKTGEYQITYTATAPDGGVGRAVRTVEVVDSFDQEATSIPVLMYHYVYTLDDVPDNVGSNHILDTKLREHCKYLSDNDYYYPSYQELVAFVEGEHTLPAKSVILTFDDGEIGFLDYGIPILNEYEVPATSFIVCSDDYTDVKITAYSTPYVQFQSHSYNMHRGSSGIGQGGIIHAYTKSQIADDLAKSAEILGEATALAYPFGDNNQDAYEALEEGGWDCAFTVKNDRIRPGDNPFALNRVRIVGDYSQDAFINLVRPNA